MKMQKHKDRTFRKEEIGTVWKIRQNSRLELRGGFHRKIDMGNSNSFQI